MSTPPAKAFVSHIADIDWKEYPGHFGGALVHGDRLVHLAAFRMKAPGRRSRRGTPGV